jgi:hypothetical protein
MQQIVLFQIIYDCTFFIKMFLGWSFVEKKGQSEKKSMFLWNIGIHVQDYKVSQAQTPHSEVPN